MVGIRQPREGGLGMFTGIVEEQGRVRSRDGSRFVFEATVVTDDVVAAVRFEFHV